MDTLKGITYAVLQGLYDSVKGIVVVFYMDREMNKKSELIKKSGNLGKDDFSESGSNRSLGSSGTEPVKRHDETNIMKRVFQCCALNGGVFWLSIIVFEYGILPTIKLFLTLLIGEGSGLGSTLWSWMNPFLQIIFGMIWILPLFLLSKIVNSLWFQDIADSAYKFRKGRPQLLPSVSKMIADSIFSLLVQLLFLAQSTVIKHLPIEYLARAIFLVHVCMLYSLYSFEYKWFNMGWELHKRLSFIENNWPYFLGFGLPLTLLTEWPNSYVVSGCVFSIAFPIFILSGNEANPTVGSCDFPLRLFSPVVAITNVFFNRSVRQRSTKSSSSTIIATNVSARPSPGRKSSSMMR